MRSGVRALVVMCSWARARPRAPTMRRTRIEGTLIGTGIGALGAMIWDWAAARR